MYQMVENELQQLDKTVSVSVTLTAEEEIKVSNLLEAWGMTLGDFAKHCILMISDAHTRSDGSIR